MRSAVCRSNEHTAWHVAGSVLRKFDDLGGPVSKAADDERFRAACGIGRRDALERELVRLFPKGETPFETVYVLESFYEAPRDQVAEVVRSLVAFDSVVCVDPALLLRAAEVYETDRIDFTEAYLVACAESTGVAKIASFDRSLDRVPTVERLEPSSL